MMIKQSWSDHLSCVERDKFLSTDRKYAILTQVVEKRCFKFLHWDESASVKTIVPQHLFIFCNRFTGSPLTYNINSAQISQWIHSWKSDLYFPFLFFHSNGNTGHFQADRPPPVRHTVHHLFLLCRGVFKLKMWPKGCLVGTFNSIFPTAECLRLSSVG